MAEIIMNCQFVKTQFASGESNTFNEVDTGDMLDYFEREEACDYTQDGYGDNEFEVNTSDAFNYYNYRIGSTGGFGKRGDLVKNEANDLIDKYRPEYMYRMVFSFEEDFLREANFLSKPKFQKLITKSMEKNIRLMKLDPDNVEWGCYYHTNTKHPHCHIWLFEKEPTKDYLKIPKKQFAKMRSNIVRNMALNTEMYAERDIKTKELYDQLKSLGLDTNPYSKTKNNHKKFFAKDKELAKMMIDLEKKLPKTGSMKFNSKNIRPFHDEINKIVDKVLSNTSIKDYYKEFNTLLEKEKKIYDNRYFTDEEKMKKNKFIDNKQKEVKDKIANMILQNIKNYRLDKNEYQKVKMVMNSKGKTYSANITAKHSMQARSAVLNAGVLDELSKSIDQSVYAIASTEHILEEMINKAEQQIHNNTNSITL